MGILMKNIQINDYKGINSLIVNLSDSKTCLVGKNASGKTSILESISGFISRYQFYDFARNVEFTLEISKELVPILDKYGIDKVEVIFKQDKNSHAYEFISVKGMEKIIESKSEELFDLKEIYDTHIIEIYDLLIEIKKQIIDVEKYLDKDTEKLVFNYPINKLESTINSFDEYFNKKKSILPVLFSDLYPELELSNHRIGLDLFNLDFISETEYDEFKRNVDYLTIDDHGVSYDIGKMDEYYYDMKAKFDRVRSYLSIGKDRYSNNSSKYDEQEDKFYEIVYELKNVRRDVIDVCEKYLRSITLISSSSFEKNIGKNINLTDKECEYIGIFDERLVTKEVSTYSYGEKWIYHLIHRILEDESGLICIDEPGMYLNPLYQKKIIELFERLNEEGKQIVYATHIEMLVPLDNKSNVYITYIDEMDSVQIKKADFTELASNSELFIGDLIIKSIKKVIIVEGENDKLLLDYYTIKHPRIDESKFDIYDCKGNGIHQALKLCTYMNIDFKAIIDLDQIDDLKDSLGNVYNKFENCIEYAGNDEIRYIEGWMQPEDIEILCRPDKKNKRKMKMNIDKVEKFVESKGTLSSEFEEKLYEVLNKLIIDWK